MVEVHSSSAPSAAVLRVLCVLRFYPCAAGKILKRRMRRGFAENAESRLGVEVHSSSASSSAVLRVLCVLRFVSLVSAYEESVAKDKIPSVSLCLCGEKNRSYPARNATPQATSAAAIQRR